MSRFSVLECRVLHAVGQDTVMISGDADCERIAGLNLRLIH